MRRSLIALSVLALSVTACGRGDDDTDTAPEPTFATPSATATPSDSATPTTPAEETPDPDAPPVDYRDEGGVVVTGPGGSAALNGAPRDFSAFVDSELSRLRTTGLEGCGNDPQIRVDTLQAGGWAAGGVTAPECGGYAVLWARSGNQWAQVWSGQELVDCGTLMRYEFPISVVGTQCLGQNGTASTYNG